MHRVQPKGSDKILSYGDVLLRRSDVDLLNGPHWLNDQVITFFFEYLGTERFTADQSKLLFVGGALTFLLSQLLGDDAVGDILAPLKMPSRELVFFAINNNPDASSAEGGSHWSLAVFSRQDKALYHYDSCRGSRNIKIAKQIAKAIQPSLGDPAAISQVQEPTTPQQTNANDCGVYVLACAEVIAAQWSTEFTLQKASQVLARHLTPETVAEKREQILDIIQTKAAAAPRH